MNADQEPAPSEENNGPPYLTFKELNSLGHSFTYDDFNVVTPTEGEPFLVITTPENGRGLVDMAFAKAREVAFEEIRKVGEAMVEADEREKGMWSELYLPTFGLVHSSYLSFTLLPILLAAQLGAQINALTAISQMGDAQERELAMKELEKKQASIGNFLGSGERRYMFYSGEKLIYKTPADLENPYNPQTAGRQN